MSNRRDDEDPLTGQTFSGMSDGPMAGMPEPPPKRGEPDNRGKLIALGISLVIFVALIAAIIIF